jgi:DNA-directed RNA polymerase specialized sigma24 family protein
MAVMQLPRRGRTRVEFERFVDTCAGALLRTGYLIVWNLEETEDLVQETLLRVARRWPRVRRMDQPAAYARRILVNLAINDAKRRSRRRRELEPPDGAPLEAHADRAAAGMFEAFDAPTPSATNAPSAGSASSAAPRSPRSTSRADSPTQSGTCFPARKSSLPEAPLFVWRPDRPVGLAPERTSNFA